MVRHGKRSKFPCVPRKGMGPRTGWPRDWPPDVGAWICAEIRLKFAPALSNGCPSSKRSGT
ncbi:unnamed protein product [Amoebophrya sp. A120]|nr:unnamed protein product [Amoebophrya sp. A120]|eukprot:GSA120T00017276001.1